MKKIQLKWPHFLFTSIYDKFNKNRFFKLGLRYWLLENYFHYLLSSMQQITTAVLNESVSGMCTYFV